MNKFIYHIMFDNGNTITFESDIDINFHEIGVSEYGGGTMLFGNTFINLQHVVFIDKEAKNDG